MESIHSMVEICNHHNDIGPFLREAIKEIRRIAGVREAGIALNSRISYVDHIATEGIRQQIEELGSKPEGLMLKQLRKSVLSGTVDTRLPYFSSRGSFFSNDLQALLSELIQGTEPIDAVFHRTMAFIPIYAQTKVIGIVEVAEAGQWNDVAALLYTGGTTGVSKGVMLTHANLSSNVQQFAAWFPDLNPAEERLVGNFPVFHSAGFTAIQNYSAWMGHEVILVPRPETAINI